MNTRELVIIAGPNGSGKTTFARSFVPEKEYEFLNADEIVNENIKKGKSNSPIAAGKEYFIKLEKLISTKKNIIIESTLSGLFMINLIRRFKKEKYNITIIFIFLNTPQICIERIHERVLKGGHSISNEDVKRRYYRSISNFWNTYRMKADQWLLLNNSQSDVREVAEGMKQNMNIKDENLMEFFLETLKRHKK